MGEEMDRITVILKTGYRQFLSITVIVGYASTLLFK